MDITKIGKGGFSSVYTAKHRVDQQIYAVKKSVLKIPEKCDPESVQEELNRMIQEARLFASISNPHIIRYNHSWVETLDYSGDEKTGDNISFESPYIEFDTNDFDANGKDSNNSSDEESGSEDQDDNSLKISLFIQMELCKETLEDYLNERTSILDTKEYNKSLDIASQLIDGIYAIHKDYKIIHRDLSLRNIFIGKNDVIKVGDFGLAIKSHFIQIEASPFPFKPKEPLPGEYPDFLSLEDKSEGSFTEELNELTGGIGTKTFSAPEQLLGDPYDQKADIYSLGLILFVLFYPTQTLSERYQILCDCRKSGPPKEFMEKYPEIGMLIRRMTDNDPIKRPDIDELKKFTLFKTFDPFINKSWNSLNLKGKKCIVKIGESEKTKTKYAKIIGDNLLLYARKIDKKAKLYYPLNECKISTSGNVVCTPRGIKRNCSSCNFKEDLKAIDHSCKILIEHPQLETLYIFFQTDSLKVTSKMW